MRILAILAGSIVISVLLFLTRPETHAGLKPVSPQFISTVEVAQGDIRHSVTIAGKLQPVRTVTIPFEVSGRVTGRYIEPGQSVEKGDRLLDIDNSDYQDAVIETRAALDLELSAIERDQALLQLAREELKILQRELDRLAKLEQKSLASESRFDDAKKMILQQREHEASLEHSVNSAIARKAKLQAALNRSNRNLQRSTLVAHFPALVNRVSVEVGDYVNQGQQVLELIQVEQMDVYLEVSGSIATHLRLEQEVPVMVESETYTGQIVAVSVNPDAITNTHAVRVRVDGRDLYPGTIVRVQLPGQFYSQAKLIPVSALLRDAGEHYVFVVEDNKLSRINVSMLANINDQYVIDGIEAGTEIAANDVTAYKHGQDVDPHPL